MTPFADAPPSLVSAPLILVADAAPALTTVLLTVLLEEGYQPTAVHDGVAALRRMLDQPPALVLLDADLPGMSGVAVLQALRAAAVRPPPVILITVEVPARRYMALGAAAVLRKPFDIDHLLQTITAFLAPGGEV